MSGTSKTTTRGTIEKVDVKGSGPASGQVSVSLVIDPQHHASFFVFMNTPRDKFFSILRTAYEAMWDSRTVEIVSVPYYGDQEITSISVV